MKRACILIIILMFCFNSISVYAKEYSFKRKIYDRSYEDNSVRINFYQIDYLEDKKLEKEINYLLEKFSFETVYSSLKNTYKVYTGKDIKFKDVLYWIDNLKNEDFSFTMSPYFEGEDIFRLGYIDDNMINIGYMLRVKMSGAVKGKEYTNRIGDYSINFETGNFILDIKTKQEIKLSDLIELDERLLEYKIGDGITDYNSIRITQYKNFKDAFEIYENIEEKDWNHDKTLEEVIKGIENNEYAWYLDKDKNLVFYLQEGIRSYTEFKIDYEFIKPLLKDKYKYL